MVQTSGDARFVEEHSNEVAIVGQMIVQPLHRVEALKASDTGEPRQEDPGHTATGDLANQLVAPEPSTLTIGLLPIHRCDRAPRKPIHDFRAPDSTRKRRSSPSKQ